MCIQFLSMKCTPSVPTSDMLAADGRWTGSDPAWIDSRGPEGGRYSETCRRSTREEAGCLPVGKGRALARSSMVLGVVEKRNVQESAWRS